MVHTLFLQRIPPIVVSEISRPELAVDKITCPIASGQVITPISKIFVDAVVAFTVSLRTQEIGIRMALGAPRTSIARLVLILGAKIALLGCGFGVLASLALSRLVSSFLFEVSAPDPLICLGSVLVMMSMALLASALPATRAASSNPIEILRSS
jgi:ABC-type lipoprotein release transport system permease subunit